jgi:hypothetical protein
MRRSGLALAVVAVLLTGCGSGDDDSDSSIGRPTLDDPVPRDREEEQRPVVPPAGPEGAQRRVPAAATRVIKGWADTLRAGDVAGAADYFALPSIVQIQPGAEPVRITERKQAVAFNLVLPCGGRLLRTERDGRYVNALFRLTHRPGARCDAPGTTARTDFVIAGGKIAEWRRAPDEPGDPERPGAPGGPVV